MKHIVIIALLLFTASISAQNIVEQESKIDFKIGSILWSKVKGEIPRIGGNVIFDKNNLADAKFDVFIHVDSIKTGNKKRDAHLKNDDFFDISTYPKISFKSENIYVKDGEYFTLGKLTIKDVTKSITIPFDINKVGKKSVLIGEFEIERLDYNIGVNESKILVDKTVSITITCVLNN